MQTRFLIFEVEEGATAEDWATCLHEMRDAFLLWGLRIVAAALLLAFVSNQ